MLMALYIFNVFAVGYIVFALERNHGTCMQYKDVVWMMGVTITNLGFGDFTPSSSGKVSHLRSHEVTWLRWPECGSWPLKVSRFMIAMLSLLGIFQTALIVGVLSETLVIPPDEKRILASVEKQRKFTNLGQCRLTNIVRCWSNSASCSSKAYSSNLETFSIQ